MTILEIWLIALSVFLWLIGGQMTWKAGISSGFDWPWPRGAIIAIWPLVALYVLLGG